MKITFRLLTASPGSATALSKIVALLLICFSSSIAQENDQTALESHQTAPTVARPTSVRDTDDPDRLMSNIVFPDGDEVTIKWGQIERPEFEKFPPNERFTYYFRQALEGNPDAAFAAFYVLDECAGPMRYDADFEAHLAGLRTSMEKLKQQPKNAGKGITDEYIETYMTHARENYNSCKKIDPDQIANREELLRQGANGGNPTARTWLGQSSSELAEGIRLLEEAWGLGHYNALEHLANRYQQRFAASRSDDDRVKALAVLYLNAAVLENGQTLRGHEPNRLTHNAWQDVENYARWMEQHQIEDAIQSAKSMLKTNGKCCLM